MLKKSVSFIILVCCIQSVFAQNLDSITFVDANWDKSRIARKTKLFTHHFNSNNLFAANQYISYLEVKNTGKSPVFAIGSELQQLKPTSVFGKDAGAIAAINGTFFDMKNGGSVDYVKVNGIMVAPNRLTKGSTRTANQRAAVTINDGRLNIKKWDKTALWEQGLPEENIMVSGPLLTLNNQDEQLSAAAFNTTRHPRSAIGIKPDGKVILLTIDGRNSNSAGASLIELTKIMKWLGCTSAINLDGGGSSTLWINGFPENGIVNFPCDNKQWDHAGERNVANVILLKKRN